MLYTPPAELGRAPNWLLLGAVHTSDSQAKALFRALLCVVFSYDPVGWGVPYAHSLVHDTHNQVRLRVRVRARVTNPNPNPNPHPDPDPSHDPNLALTTTRCSTTVCSCS